METMIVADLEVSVDTLAKNRLQEYLDSIGQPKPVYNTKLVGGESNNPIYKSTVILPDGVEITGLSFRGKKKKAEFSAARIALKYLKTAKVPSMSKSLFTLPPLPPSESTFGDIPAFTKIGLYIVLETKANIADNIATIIDLEPDIQIKAFAAVGAAVLSRDYHEQIQLIEVPCTRKDGADMGLMVAVTVDIVNNKVTHVIVATGDKFGNGIVDCLRGFTKLGGQSDHRACCCTRIRDIKAALNNLTKTGDFELAPNYS